MSRFMLTFAVLALLAAFSAFTVNGHASSVQDDDTYRTELTGVLNDWLAFADANGYSVVESEIFKIEDDDGYVHEVNLKPGFYTVWAQPDSRYKLTSAGFWITGEADDFLGGEVWGEPTGSVSRCEFTNPADQKVDIKLHIYRFLREGAFAAYMLVYSGELDQASRENYIRKELEKQLISAVNDDVEVIDSDYAILSRENSACTLEFSLRSGRYDIRMFPGTLISNVDFAVLGEDGEVLAEPFSEYSRSVYFTLENARTVTVQITAVEFADESTEDYYCWILKRIGDYEGY
jgi:hypothetical protein